MRAGVTTIDPCARVAAGAAGYLRSGTLATGRAAQWRERRCEAPGVSFSTRRKERCLLHRGAMAPDTPQRIIVELCQQFYAMGWATGTGGGIGLRQDGRIYL